MVVLIRSHLPSIIAKSFWKIIKIMFKNKVGDCECFLINNYFVTTQTPNSEITMTIKHTNNFVNPVKVFAGCGCSVVHNTTIVGDVIVVFYQLRSRTLCAPLPLVYLQIISTHFLHLAQQNTVYCLIETTLDCLFQFLGFCLQF